MTAPDQYAIDKLEWHSGPPPHVGWWESSIYGIYPGLWRWWDGAHWSTSVNEYARPQLIKERSEQTQRNSKSVKWRYRWPANACVARINPETGEVTGAGPHPNTTKKVAS